MYYILFVILIEYNKLPENQAKSLISEIDNSLLTKKCVIYFHKYMDKKYISNN